MQVNSINNNNPNFKSRIVFVDLHEYSKLLNSAITLCTEDKVKRFDESAVTEGLYYCIGGVFKKKKANHIFHLFPGTMFDKADEHYNEFAACKTNAGLKAISEQKTKGLIIGGWNQRQSEYWNKENILSLRLYNFLKKYFKKNNNADFSVFVGQAGGYNTNSTHCSFIHDLSYDTYFVKLYRKGDKPYSPSDIRNHFDIISISPNDQVFSSRDGELTRIENAYLNKSDYKLRK